MTTWKLTGRKRMQTHVRWFRAPLVVVQVQEVRIYKSWHVDGVTGTATPTNATEYRWRDAHPDDLLPRVAGETSHAHLAPLEAGT